MKIADHMPQQQGGAPNTPPAREALPPEEGKEKPGEQSQGNQETYDQVVLQASDILYSEETMPDVLSMLEAGADNPAKAIADTAVFVIGQLDDASGGSIPEDVVIPAAAEVAELLAELAQARGIFQADDQVIGQAGQYLLLGIAEMYGVEESDIQEVLGGMSEDELQRVAQEQSQFAVV